MLIEIQSNSCAVIKPPQPALMPKPLNIDRAAWFLIRCYGDDCAKVAYQRFLNCTGSGDDVGAHEWKLVMKRAVELHFSERKGRLH